MTYENLNKEFDELAETLQELKKDFLEEYWFLFIIFLNNNL